MYKNIHQEMESRSQEYSDYTKGCPIYNEEIRKESESYIDSPVSDWPEIEINWDYRKSSQFLIIDRCTPELFKRDFSQGFYVGIVNSQDLDRKIFKFKTTEKEGIWGIEDKRKLAYLIAHSSRGLPVSPPLVKPNEGVLHLQSGCHRYALAKALKVSQMPICVEPKYKNEMKKFLQIKWFES